MKHCQRAKLGVPTRRLVKHVERLVKHVEKLVRHVERLVKHVERLVKHVERLVKHVERLVKHVERSMRHVERGNFSMILHRTAKNLLRRGHGKDLVQLTPLHNMGQEGETH